MTWPTAATKTHLDQATDDPKQARTELASLIDKFNQMQAHVTTFSQTVLDDTTADAWRTTLGLNTPTFSGNVTIDKASPSFYLYNTGAAAVRFFMSGDTFLVRGLTDDRASQVNAYSFAVDGATGNVSGHTWYVNGTSAANLIAQTASLTSNTNVVTKKHLDEYVFAAGGFAWTEVTGSRSAGTSYQNTTGAAMMVAVTADVSSGTALLQVSDDNATWIDVAQWNASATMSQASIVVPDTWYYRAQNVDISVWSEFNS